jgi:hypothetical protein
VTQAFTNLKLSDKHISSASSEKKMASAEEKEKLERFEKLEKQNYELSELVRSLTETCKILHHCLATNEKCLPNDSMQIAVTLQKTASDHKPIALLIATLVEDYITKDARHRNCLDYMGCTYANQGLHLSDVALSMFYAATMNAPMPASSTSIQNEKIKEPHIDSEHLAHIWDNVSYVIQACGSIAHRDSNQKLDLQLPAYFSSSHQRIRISCSEIEQPFHPFNISIIPHPYLSGNYLLNLRASNYWMNDTTLKYEYPPTHPGIQTRNFMATVSESELLKLLAMNKNTNSEKDSDQKKEQKKDQELNELNVSKIYELRWKDKPFPGDISGCEDCRLVWNAEQKQLAITFTSLEVIPRAPKDRDRMDERRDPRRLCCSLIDLGESGRKRPRLVSDLGSLANKEEKGLSVNKMRDYSILKLEIEKHDLHAQKNWATFARKGEIFAVYSFLPLVVLRLDPLTGKTVLVSLDVHRYPLAKDWRGSSPLLRIQKPKTLGFLGINKPEKDCEYYMALVHLSQWPKYSHQFAVFKLQDLPKQNPGPGSVRAFHLILTHVSSVFAFQFVKDVEFSCGMVFDSNEDRILIPWSHRDRHAYLDSFSTQELSKFQRIKEI